MESIYTLKHIETPRLLIRPIQSGDSKQLHQAIAETLPQLQQWMPWTKTADQHTTDTFVEFAVQQWQSGRAQQFPMAVIDKASNTIIAASGFNEKSIPITPLYEIGYWMHKSFQGQGLVTECVNALTRYALEALQANRVQINTDSKNHKSIAVAERAGYRREMLMKNDRRDCTTDELADSLLLSCCDSADLPPLKVSWQHGDSRIIADAPTTAHLTSDHPMVLPLLKTERLILRAPITQDVITVHEALLASVNKVSPWFSWATPGLKQEHLAAHLNDAIDAAKDIKKNNHLFFLVWNAADNTFVGEVWFKIYDWSIMSASVAYWFDSRHTGNGYATEAVKCVMQYAFDELNAHRLTIDVSTQNDASLRLVKRLGLGLEGQLKNRYRNFVTNEITDGLNFVATDINKINT